MQSGQHDRPRRHALRVLRVGATLNDALGRERVHDGCRCDRPASAAEGVIALLIRGHEKDLTPIEQSYGSGRSYQKGV